MAEAAGPLVIYGDLNCPFSALASLRAGILEDAGVAAIDWRAVSHLSDLPPQGRPVRGELADQLADELEVIRSLLLDDEHLELHLPTVQPDTRPATAAFAAAPASDRRALRERIFHAYWVEGRDIGNRDVLADLGLNPPAEPPTIATTRQDEWRGLDEPVTPSMRLPRGYVSRGLGALRRLADSRPPSTT